MNRPRILISAGEVSGDRIGGLIAKALLARDPNLQLCGIGGRAMQSEGVELWAEATHLGAIGVFEVIRVLPEVTRIVRILRRRLRHEKPGAAILIASDGLNASLGWFLRSHGIPTIAYPPPTIWMWQAFAHIAGLFFDRILAAFPAEVEGYQGSRADVRFVGHYLRDLVWQSNAGSRAANLEAIPHIAILPGSRQNEFESFTPILLDTALEIERRLGRPCCFSLPLASSDYATLADEMIGCRQLQGRVHCEDSSLEVMARADVGVIASGTASLEAALVGLPFILFYRLWGPTAAAIRLSQWLGILSANFLGLPNLVAGREIVPELYQKQVRPDRLAKAAVDLLQNPDRRARMRADFREVAAVLGDGHSLERIAEEVGSLVSTESGSPPST